MVQKQSKAAMLVKKKIWLPIIAPQLFHNQPIGEITVEEPEKAIGRRVTVSLMTLTNDPSRQTIHVSFTINKVENNQCRTVLHGYSIIPAAVRKMMRRGRERVDDSFVTKTSDGTAIRIKPVLITRGRTKGGALSELRSQLKLSILRAVNKMPFAELIKSLVAHRLQKEISQPLHRIYPVQICELRDVHIETGEKGLKNIVMAPPEKIQPSGKHREEPKSEETNTADTSQNTQAKPLPEKEDKKGKLMLSQES